MPSSDHSSANRRKQGAMFEKLASEYFSNNGYKILEKNWHAGHKEIDLIARKNDLVVFIEVKSSFSKKFGHPAERVDRKKINNLVSAARQYMIVNELEKVDLRFDVITFTDGRLEHFPDAFQVE